MILNGEYRYDNNLTAILDLIDQKYREIIESIDKKGETIYSCHYSTIIMACPVRIEKLKKLFPKFNISPIYAQYVQIGFNKKSILSC